MQWWWSTKEGERRNKRSALLFTLLWSYKLQWICATGTSKTSDGFLWKHISRSHSHRFNLRNFDHRTVRFSFHTHKPAAFCFTSNNKTKNAGLLDVFAHKVRLKHKAQCVGTSCERVCRDSVKLRTLAVSSTRIIRTRILHVARMGEGRDGYRRRLRNRHHSEGIVVHGRIILKWIFKKCDGGTWWSSWLRHCAVSREVTGSIPDGVFGIFLWHSPQTLTRVPGIFPGS